MPLTGSPLRRWVAGAVVGVALVAAMTGLIWLVDPNPPFTGLLVLYLLAVLPVAIWWGAGPALVASVSSTFAFVLVFDPPRPGRLAAVTLGVFTATSIVVADLAAGLRRSARESERLAGEQSALRRVATLVAEGVPAADLFEAVTREVGLLWDADLVRMERYEPDGTAAGVAAWGRSAPHQDVDVRIPPGEVSVARDVRRAGGPVRIEGFDGVRGSVATEARTLGIRVSIGCPVVVGGELWGVIAVSSRSPKSFPPDTETRVARFTELVATAITNAESRAELRRIADEQAALRRVATLAARGGDPSPVFAAVADEVMSLFGADCTSILRFEDDGTATYLAARGWRDPGLRRPGTRRPSDQPATIEAVRRTRRPARLSYAGLADDDLPPSLRGEGIRSGVAGPILVEGRLWGIIGVASRGAPIAADTEERMIAFTEIVATAIANTESRAQLAASRARVIATADATRRRLERDLHDGAQQRLVSLALELRNTQAEVPNTLPALSGDLGRMADDLTEVLDELRELSRGIHPAILSESGLGPALRTLARRSAVPVELSLRLAKRYADPVEVAAYYVVSEALTNTAKHANATHAEIVAEERDGTLRLLVRDDGVGGTDLTDGTGLAGLSDRVEALGGTFRITSPAGGGTRIQVSLPLSARDGQGTSW
ncbi:GAF domain-containing protein [Jiangella asiatica]|uniref:GAF domain-containing protein n=1 Tax=Jiangella asiatica TaxID=2530372 RepID=UPI0013A5EE79|nr:GAF domain-containing protein [Jiangella asiatica]